VEIFLDFSPISHQPLVIDRDQVKEIFPDRFSNLAALRGD